MIEGVVDLVKKADRLRMYDIKTHYCEEVRHHQTTYAAQLKVYAYIWERLRGHSIQDMGVIAIQLPHAMREAIRTADRARIARELESWNPLVSISPDPASIEATFDRIAQTVDLIEDGVFSPPPPERLAQIVGADQNTGGQICPQ